jgi:hypothetical protein
VSDDLHLRCWCCCSETNSCYDADETGSGELMMFEDGREQIRCEGEEREFCCK